MVGMIGALLLAVTALTPGTLDAQSSRQPDADTPRILVPSLASSDTKLGVQAADAIRSRLSQDFSYKTLWVISRADINGTLEASGYKADQVLTPVDANQLSRLLRADEYLEGRVEKDGDTYRIKAKLVLTRDRELVQPLPPVEAKRLDLVAMLLSREVQAARKQHAGEKECIQLARDKKFDEAISAANRAVEAYPNATLARLCKASVLYTQKAGADTVLAVANQVLAIDSLSRPALALAAEAYKTRGDCGRAMELWAEHLATDPTNLRLQQNFATEAAACGQAQRAIPVIKRAIDATGGDPQLIRLYFLVLLSARDWKQAAMAGEELVKTDTAAADTLFFRRMAAAYAGDSQPQKAAEWAARGVQKFPNNASLIALQAQMLKDAGQLQPSIEAWRRAIAADPKVPRGWVNVAQLYMDLKQPDSAQVAFRQAVAAGSDSASFLAGYALTQGNALRKVADSTKTREDYRKAFGWVALADSLAPSPNSKLLVGLISYQIGVSAAQDAQKAKSCDLAKMAQENFLTAQINIPAGGATNPQVAGQVMQALGQYAPYADQLAKSLCK